MRTSWLYAIFVLLLTVGDAGAATVDFDVAGNFTDTFHDNFGLTGSLVVDPTLNLFISASLHLVGQPWPNIVAQGVDAVSPLYDLSIQTTFPNEGSPPFDTLLLVLSNDPATLAALGGGSFSGSALLNDAGFSITGSGTLSAVPLPAALPLFATGLAGLGWLSRRRRKQAA